MLDFLENSTAKGKSLMKTVSGWFGKPIQAIALAATLSMVLLASGQVLFRYILRISVPWTEEVARVLFIWMIFIGTALVELDGSQVRTTMLIDTFPKKIRAAWEGIVTLFSITFQAALLIGSVKSFSTEAHLSLGSVPWLDYRALFLPMIIAAPLCIFFMIANLIGAAKKLLADAGRAGA